MAKVTRSGRPVAAKGDTEGVVIRDRVPISTRIERGADEAIRLSILHHRGTLAAWWEELSVWLVERPEVIEEISTRMEGSLGGRQRRPM